MAGTHRSDSGASVRLRAVGIPSVHGGEDVNSWISLISKVFAPDSIFGMDKRGLNLSTIAVILGTETPDAECGPLLSYYSALGRTALSYLCIKSAVNSDGPQPWSRFYREERCEAR